MKTYIYVSYTLKRSAACSCKAKHLKLFDIWWCWILAYMAIKLNSDFHQVDKKKQMILIFHSLENMWKKTFQHTVIQEEKKELKQKATWKYN